MSIPKLKVYRLDTDFDEASDNDVQSQSKDELLPIEEKRLNPLTAVEEMVGVKLRGDCRVVTRGVQAYVDVQIDSSGEYQSMQTLPVPCEGWLMGKANIEVAVMNAAGNGWYVLDKRLWDYDVTEVKQYLVNGAYQGTPDVSDTTEIHNISHIVIRFGSMMISSTIAGGDQKEYSSTWNADGNSIRIYYYPYYEHETVSPVFGDALTDQSTASAPFSSIYNGNLDGRTIHYSSNDSTVSSGRSMPDRNTVVRKRMNRYEGNYLYRRRIFPLRVKEVALSDGACIVTASVNWYADGMMAPVFMEKVPLESGGWTYKRLEEGTQLTKVYSISGNNASYTVTMNKSYYRLSGDDYCYPGHIYVFYNFTDDDMGELFDFDFKYSDTDGEPSSFPALIQYDIYGGYNISVEDENQVVHYVHMNSGSLVRNTQKSAGWLGNFYLKHEFLAVKSDYGYDADFGDVRLEDGSNPNTVEFTIPQSFVKNGLAGYTAALAMGIQVYHNGVLIGGSGSTPASMATGYYVSVSGDTVTVTHPATALVDDEPVPVVVNDLMVSCAVIPPSSLDGGDIVGYRVPCYEKVKKSTLFVSSYPNWLKGHLNNDLDVFVGYSQYSGVNTKDEQIDSIYPKYVKDGWHPMYPDGALQFSEPVEEYDYYDIFNFGVLSGAVKIADGDSGAWIEISSGLLPNYCPTDGSLGKYRIYCNRVMYNVAHYDAIHQVVRGRMSNISVQGGQSTYKLLTDEVFPEAVGRRWTFRHDSYVRRMYSSGQDQLPRIVDSTDGGRERPSSAASMGVGSGTAKIISTDMSSDRVMFIKYVLSGSVQRGFIICLNTASTAFSEIEFASLTDADIRIHVKMEDGVLNVGPETSSPQAPVANLDSATVFAQAVTWTPLLDRPDEVEQANDESVDLDAIQDEADDGNGGQYRYVYTGLAGFNVCFEPFAYHYTYPSNSGDSIQTDSVEFMVYRVRKP